MAAENNNNIAPSKLTENDVDLHNITMPWPLKATVLPKEPILARVAIKEPLAIEILNVILRVDIVLPNNKTFNIGKDEKCRVLLDKNMDKDWRVFLFNVHLTTPFLLPGDYKVRYSVIIRDGALVSISTPNSPNSSNADSVDHTPFIVHPDGRVEVPHFGGSMGSYGDRSTGLVFTAAFPDKLYANTSDDSVNGSVFCLLQIHPIRNVQYTEACVIVQVYRQGNSPWHTVAEQTLPITAVSEDTPAGDNDFLDYSFKLNSYTDLDLVAGGQVQFRSSLVMDGSSGKSCLADVTKTVLVQDISEYVPEEDSELDLEIDDKLDELSYLL
ncbi:hypothetical protein SCUCBS95973_002358 [Sporothrix curviconia]|uniref:Uncharacterized protein n=1 Tax=Sporothrix curviconia TaxID=1260050 RepID=A0ABP0B660_9PEZI